MLKIFTTIGQIGEKNCGNLNLFFHTTLKLKNSVRYTNCYKKTISFYSSLKNLPSMFSALGTLIPH